MRNDMEDTVMLFEQDDIKDTTPATPIIKWQGGKRLLAKHILPLFPPHRCYVEVFCGGAALFFMRKERSYVEVINDINGELINLYRVVAHHMDELIRQFDWLQLNSREQFNQLKATPPSLQRLSHKRNTSHLHHQQSHRSKTKKPRTHHHQLRPDNV